MDSVPCRRSQLARTAGAASIATQLADGLRGEATNLELNKDHHVIYLPCFCLFSCKAQPEGILDDLVQRPRRIICFASHVYTGCHEDECCIGLKGVLGEISLKVELSEPDGVYSEIQCLDIDVADQLQVCCLDLFDLFQVPFGCLQLRITFINFRTASVLKWISETHSLQETPNLLTQMSCRGNLC